MNKTRWKRGETFPDPISRFNQVLHFIFDDEIMTLFCQMFQSIGDEKGSWNHKIGTPVQESEIEKRRKNWSDEL